MKTGMIIVNYNDYESTKELIDNVIDYKSITKIVVVDNHSTDDSLKELIKIKDKKVDVLENDSNKGYSSAINLGTKYLINKYKGCNIIVSNSDIIIKDEKDIIKLLDTLKDKDVAVVAPNILEHGQINRGWKLVNPFIESLTNIVFFHKYFEKWFVKYNKNKYMEDLVKVDVVSGCFFLIKSKVLDSINYLDENVFLYYEENILAKKLKEKKLNTIIDNRVQVIHNHSITIDKNINKINKYKILKKSKYYYNVKYNNANVIEKGLLKVTDKCTLGILYVLYSIKDLFRGKK